MTKYDFVYNPNEHYDVILGTIVSFDSSSVMEVQHDYLDI